MKKDPQVVDSGSKSSESSQPADDQGSAGAPMENDENGRKDTRMGG